MLVLDDVTIAAGIAVLAIAIVAPLLNVLLARLKGGAPVEEVTDNAEAETPDADASANETEQSEYNSQPLDAENVKAKPGISIVVTVDDEVEALRNNLPKWLGQQYGGDFQLVVVLTGNDEIVENTLKQYLGDKHLYTTFIPASSRYMSRRKLAITVGVKAANYDWIMLTDVNCSPDSTLWLDSMSQHCTESTDLVLGYTNMSEENKSSWIFDFAHLLYRQLARAQRGSAFAYSGANMMFRKNLFINGKGFDGNLKFLRGEYDFIVNKFSNGTNTDVALEPDALVTEEELTRKAWRNKGLYYLSTRRNLSGIGVPKFCFGLTMVMMVLSNLCFIAVIAFSAIAQEYILTVVAAVAMLLSWILRTVVLAKTLKPWAGDMSPVKMFWFEQTMPLRNLRRRIKYRFTDKYDFITHKI